jgi:uncharacterized phage-associated protein
VNFIRKEYNPSALTASQIEKIGNALIFLSEKIKPLYKTSALKLIYLLEEICIRKYGLPFFGVDFQLWRLGPVVKEIYIDLTSSTDLLGAYIETSSVNESTIIAAKKPFDDGEFSDCDMEILQIVVNKFKDTSGPDLIKITHRENFPWHRTAQEYGILEKFEKNALNATDIVLDLSTLLDESPALKEFYLSTLDFQRQSNNLKRAD